MAGKPTYEELERKVKELEKEAAKCGRADEMLREAQNLARLIDLAPFGVFLIDLGGKIVTCNRRGAERLGKTVEASIGTALTEYSPPEVSENRRLKGMEAIASGRTVTFEDRIGERWYQNSISPVLDEDGHPSRLAIYGVDITEYRNVLGALKKGESNLDSVFEAVPVGICFMKDRVYARVNQNWCDNFGYPEESLIGETPAFLYESREEYERVGKELYGHLPDDGIASVHTRLKRRDGEFRDVVLIAKPLNPQSVGDGTIVVVRDITERKQAEEALRRSEEKYRDLIENLNNVIYSVNAAGTITYVSPPVESILGYTPVELMGKHFAHLIHPEDLDAVHWAFSDILKGRIYPNEYRMRTKSGEFRWARSSSLPVYEDGQISGLQGVITDITEHKRIEDALRESERNYREIFNNSSDAIFVHDVETGAIVDANKTGCDVFGYTLEEIKTLVAGDLSANTPPYTYEESLQWIRKAAEQGPQHFEWIAKSRDGRLICFENSLLHANIGGKNRILVFGRNIDERKRAEEERIKLERQLHHAQKMAALGTLVAGVAHEINNPNNFITINAPMLSKAWLSIMPILEEYYDNNGDFSVGGLPYAIMRERVPQLLAGISDGAGRIKKIVSDLKNFARPDSSASFEPVDVNSAVKSSLTLVSNLLKKSTNHFKVEYGRNIPKINGNHRHLEQVVINLVQNACQALPDNNKEIRVSTTYQEKEETILIKVRDQGVGIPAESLPRIMDPFFTTKRSSGGTGLGLSVSFSIIEKHSGKLTVTSEEGKGSTFTIALPAKGKKARVKVLVVDDDDLLRETIVETLENVPRFPWRNRPMEWMPASNWGHFVPTFLSWTSGCRT